MYQLDGFITHAGYGFAIRRDWKFVDQVKAQFANYGRLGYFNQVERKYTQSQFQSETDIKPINFGSLVEVFAIVLMGGVVSAFFQLASVIHQRMAQCIPKSSPSS